MSKDSASMMTSAVGLYMLQASFFVIYFATATPSLRSLAVGAGGVTMGLVYAGWTKRFEDESPLLQQGPFAFSRHPRAFELMLLAISLGLAHGSAFFCSLMVALGGLGAFWHVRKHDHIRRARYGDKYAAYFHRVPAIIPNYFIKEKTTVQGQKQARSMRQDQPAIRIATIFIREGLIYAGFFFLLSLRLFLDNEQRFLVITVATVVVFSISKAILMRRKQHGKSNRSSLSRFF